MGRQGIADRSRVGVCGARRARRSRLRLGQRVHARRQANGQYLAWRISAPKIQRGRFRAHVSGHRVPAERLRRLRHDRQRLGMDRRLVVRPAPGGRAESVLRAGKPARRARGGQLRPVSAANQNPAQGHQRRLASVRAELLPPLPPGRAPRRAGRYVHKSRRIQVRHSRRKTLMTNTNESEDKGALSRRNILLASTTLAAASALGEAAGVRNAVAQARQSSSSGKPNILVIMGDDVGWFNIGAYHRGMMSGKTPNLDKLAADGMIFTDYYAEASCTAGRANFITGEIPLRTGLTTVGQAGADVGMPDTAVTLATVLKSLGYETAQFGKNHLGDLNKYLPTLHGFDEYFGYLYHLDAMSDPYWFDYPQDWIDKTGPRNLVHAWATDTDDPTVMPRWGKVGKQRIVDEGPLPPHPMPGIKYNMETVDDDILNFATDFMDKSKQAGKPFFVWLNPTRMHVYTHLSP